jgi:hypothetical protein
MIERLVSERGGMLQFLLLLEVRSFTCQKNMSTKHFIIWKRSKNYEVFRMITSRRDWFLHVRTLRGVNWSPWGPKRYVSKDCCDQEGTEM